MTVSPYAFVWAPSGLHSDTDFEVPVGDILRDPHLEGLLSRLTVRTGQMTTTVDILTALADSITVLASEELH